MVIEPGAGTMRDLFLLAFTANGERLACRIARQWPENGNVVLHLERVKSIHSSMKTIFRNNNILVFIGAVGIALRAVAPFLQSKMTDPAVIVIDEKGRFVIPVLSGHVGGANRIAEHIASLIDATPVITTATDINHIFSVDTFASENGYAILNPSMIKVISSHLLEGKKVGLASAFEIVGYLPENIVISDNGETGIHIHVNHEHLPFDNTLQLVPRCFHVGIGTRKNVSSQKLHDFFLETLKKQSLSVEAVATLSSINLKREEKAILDLADQYKIPFHTYTPEELQLYESLFTPSEFVRSVTGLGNVCETSAYLSSKLGEIVLHKTTHSGMALAIAKENWKVVF